MKNKVFMLWLEGVNPEKLSAVPSLAKLATSGVDLQLTPLPLVEKSACYYQTLTGMGSGKFGRFDAVYPEGYKARENTGTPDGALGRLLPDILRSQKLSVNFLETRDRGVLDTFANQAYDCAIVRLLDIGNADSAEIDAIVRAAAELATPGAHMVVLTDVWHQTPNKFVNINDFLADVGLLEVGESRKPADIIWPETLAYGLGTGQVWINLRGRESQGIVGPGREYQEVCDALVDELRTNWLDPQTNEPIIEQILRREDAYTGEYLFKAPDLIVVYRPGYRASPKATVLDFDGTRIYGESAPHETGPYARLIARGPCLVSGSTKTAALVDVMPSLMYLLGQPIPSYVDGSVISSVFTQTYTQQSPVRRIESDENLLSDEEEGLIVDRLRDLGYLG